MSASKKAAKERFRVVDGDGPTFSVERNTVVEPGVYQLAFVEYETKLAFQKAAKLALRFRILDMGPYHGKELIRWYNVKRLNGNPKKGGKFQAAARGDFLREYLTLFPDQAQHLDRMSFKPFRNAIITGRVDTIRTDSKQKPLPEPLQYSIIRELLEVVGP
jgi:hypothetical protein